MMMKAALGPLRLSPVEADFGASSAKPNAKTRRAFLRAGFKRNNSL
jgi:hypothetical protein